jgi:DNA-binding winged helix-turn-helix (wHTH) protein
VQYDVIIDPFTSSLTINGRHVQLTRQELRLFDLIQSKAGKVCSAKMVIEEFYKNKTWVDQKIIDVLVCNIRKKIEPELGNTSDLIRTVWGRGYAWGCQQVSTMTPPPTLPDGMQRWTALRKLAVVDAINNDHYSHEQILEFYPDCSMEELREWEAQFTRYGTLGLHSTRAGISV